MWWRGSHLELPGSQLLLVQALAKLTSLSCTAQLLQPWGQPSINNPTGSEPLSLGTKNSQGQSRRGCQQVGSATLPLSHTSERSGRWRTFHLTPKLPRPGQQAGPGAILHPFEKSSLQRPSLRFPRPPGYNEGPDTPQGEWDYSCVVLVLVRMVLEKSLGRAGALSGIASQGRVGTVASYFFHVMGPLYLPHTRPSSRPHLFQTEGNFLLSPVFPFHPFLWIFCSFSLSLLPHWSYCP